MKYTRVFLLLFLLELALFIGTSLVPVNSPRLLDSFTVERNSLISHSFLTLTLMIFTHNFAIATVDFIPAFGVFFMVASITVTGAVVSLEAAKLGVSGGLISLQLMTLPHSWLELPAYAVASGFSLYFLIDRRPLNSKLKLFLALWLFTGLELFLAASVESAEIKLEKLGIIYAYVVWLPSIPILYMLSRIFKDVTYSS